MACLDSVHVFSRDPHIGKATTMYRFSRSIYLDLRDRVVGSSRQREAARKTLLEVSEHTIERLALDPNFYARPAQRLFNEIRPLFAGSDQLRVRLIVQRHIDDAIAFLNTEEGTDSAATNMLRCRAATRRGKPCQRLPLPGARYCPSHKHLERTQVLTAA